MTTTHIDVLKNARELLDHPESWIQRTSAEDAFGNYVPPYCNTATRWCLSGAVNRCSANFAIMQRAGRALQETLREQHKSTAIYIYNDVKGRRHSTILRLLETTIKREELSNG